METQVSTAGTQGRPLGTQGRTFGTQGGPWELKVGPCELKVEPLYIKSFHYFRCFNEPECHQECGLVNTQVNKKPFKGSD